MTLPSSSLHSQVAESSPLVGELEPLLVLAREYAEDDHVYQAKVKVGHDDATGGTLSGCWLSQPHCHSPGSQ